MAWKRVPYNCKNCTEDQKKVRGCISPAEKQVWVIEECFYCWGENKKCKTCGGSNQIVVHRCPHALSRERSVARFIPIANRYLKYGVYPDGTMNYIRQPIALLNAISIYSYFMSKYEAEHIKNR